MKKLPALPGGELFVLFVLGDEDLLDVEFLAAEDVLSVRAAVRTASAVCDDVVHLAAVEADQVIVVMLLCQFKYGFTAFKIVAGDDTSVVKLVQYAIYRSQTNFFTHIDQTFV